jgi:tetratricopeptide (TPR) repeat protein
LGFARLKPGQTSQLYEEAMSLFLKGQVTEALKVLDEEKLRRAVEEARQSKAKAEKAMEEAIQNYLLRARLLTTQFRFEEAEKVYEEAVKETPDSFDAHFSLARFMQGLNRYIQARPAYQRALEIARQKGNRAGVAMTLNNLGVLHAMESWMGAARKAYVEALGIYEKFAKVNPESYSRDVARVKSLLKNLDKKTPVAR